MQERVMYFDSGRCVGCHACETVCKMENNLEAGPKWIECVQEEIPRGDGQHTIAYLPLNCRHCADAPCIAACPANAIYQRSDSIVLVKEEQCIGCGECLQVCPFGAPQFGAGKIMQKCNMCASRLDLGLPTACEQGCPVGAIQSGSARDISFDKRTKYLVNLVYSSKN